MRELPVSRDLFYITHIARDNHPVYKFLVHCDDEHSRRPRFLRKYNHQGGQSSRSFLSPYDLRR